MSSRRIDVLLAPRRRTARWPSWSPRPAGRLSTGPSCSRHHVDAVVALDAAAGVDDVDEQMVLGVDGHAGQVGADLGRPRRCGCGTGQHCFLKTTLPGDGVARLLGQRQQLVDHLLAVGVGQAAARRQRACGRWRRASCRDERPGPASDRASDRRAAPCRFSTPSSKACVESGRLSSTRRAASARGRREPVEPFDRAPGRRSARRWSPSAVEQAGRQLRRRARRDRCRAARRRPRRRRDGCRATARAALEAFVVRFLLVAKLACRAEAISASVLLEGLAAPRAVASLSEVPLAALDKPGTRSAISFSVCLQVASSLLGSCGQPLASAGQRRRSANRSVDCP